MTGSLGQNISGKLCFDGGAFWLANGNFGALAAGDSGAQAPTGGPGRVQHGHCAGHFGRPI